MSNNLLTALLGIVATAAADLIGAFATYIVARLRQQVIGGIRTKSYNERISELSANPTKASTEVDRILDEMADIIKELRWSHLSGSPAL